MSNGFIYVVDAHFIDKIEEEKILDPSACGIYKPMVILRFYFILPLVLMGAECLNMQQCQG
jgi:hypothetical protein